MENNINLPDNSYHTEKVTYLRESGARTIAKSFLANVFAWMFAGLFLTGIVAYWFGSDISHTQFMVQQTPRGNAISPLGWLVVFAPLGFVFLMSLGFRRLSAPMMSFLFIVYSIVNGISLSFIFLEYTSGSIAACFFSAAAMFGVMAVMGYTTKKDLTGFGSILIMALIGLLVAMLINMFLHSSGLDYIISFIGVLVFVGLTAYDVQKLKNIGMGADMADATAQKMSIMGALTLYLDFINIFLFLLRLFGNRRN
jgi:FtsH-binding integral membrane protein